MKKTILIGVLSTFILSIVGVLFVKTDGCFFWINKIKSEVNFQEVSFERLPKNTPYKEANYDDFGSLFIAHAAGQIDNLIYTNSDEAIDNSIQDGFGLIEVDVSLTSDGNYVLRHSWADDLHQDSISSEAVPTLNQFLKTPIYDIYTPLSLDGFLRKVENSEVSTVLHLKISDYDEASDFAKYINGLQSYKNISDKVYFLVNYTDVYYGMCDINSQFKDDFILWVDNDSLTRQQYEFIINNNVDILTVPSENVDVDNLRILIDKGYKVYVYTCDDLELAYDLISEGIGIYSNFLSPEIYNFCYD